MKIYQLTNTTPYQMMGYVIKTNQNKLIVIDGGHVGQSEELYRILSITGKEIDLWFLTHFHSDHYGSIIELLSEHPEIKIKKFLRNRGNEAFNLMNKEEIQEIEAWFEFEDSHPLPIYDPKFGDELLIGDVKIEVLGVANPEIENNIINNQSMVLKVTDGDFSIIFLGDLGIKGGEKLLLKNRDKVKADAVQMAHHGQQGVNKSVYQAIGAKYAFWPTPRWLWDNTEYLGGTPGNGPFKTPDVISWMEELSTINVTSFEKTIVFDTEDKSVNEV